MCFLFLIKISNSFPCFFASVLLEFITTLVFKQRDYNSSVKNVTLQTVFASEFCILCFNVKKVKIMKLIPKKHYKRS